MKLHEYQARQMLADAGVPVPGGIVANNADEAKAAYEKLAAGGATLCVVKAQVHAGGRGKGGGVKLVRSAQEAFDAAKTMMSKPLVTHQTGPDGVAVNKVLVAAGVDIAKEFYVSITVDRAGACPVMIASSEGGVEIEKVAEENPDAIVRCQLHPLMGLQPHQARTMAFKLGFTGNLHKQAMTVMTKLAALFTKLDADLVEINPLIITKPTAEQPEGQVLAIDAKMTFDDNALFRHKDVTDMFDPSETPESELKAKEFGLSYIKLDGKIGCLVNGAGLAMATMDIVKLHGSEPANFLDVGGSASEEAVTEAFRIILADPGVEGVLVNIFGGIMQCDKIARAIVAAAGKVGFKVPLVVRLEGTNVEPARKIIEQAKADIPVMQMATDLTDAAKKITAAVGVGAA
ncbi:MAG: ADP-forming succinate--CoA ligase subunit beta [Planctomycetes bacterium]|nr:ADP-forming succinate--CoA ligase subunit beta [Planctomycetota bacterium]